MRRYAIVFDKAEFTWTIVFQDDFEDTLEWFVYMKDIPERATAVEVVTALNAHRAS